MNPFIGSTEEEAEVKIRKRAEQLGLTLDEFCKRLEPARGTPEQCIEAMKEYIDKGVSLFTASFPQPADAEFFAAEVV